MSLAFSVPPKMEKFWQMPTENQYTIKIKTVKIESAVEVHSEVRLNIQYVLIPPATQFPERSQGDGATLKVLSLEQISDYF